MINNLFFEGDTFFHRLDGSIKMLLLLVWSFVALSFFNNLLFIIMIGIGFLLFKIADIPFRSIKFLYIAILVFTIFNSLFVVLFAPQHGMKYYDTYTPILTIGDYIVLKETFYYAFTLSLKYMSIAPISIIFIFTTNPSKFASSLNRLGVNYKIAYAVNLTLRYMPDIANEFISIRNSLMLKGLDIQGEKNVFKKMKLYVYVVMPLVKTSLDKVEVISNGMDLRCFGYDKKRTWYNAEKYKKEDYITIAFMVIAVISVVVIKF